jgi:hypothetical protein
MNKRRGRVMCMETSSQQRDKLDRSDTLRLMSLLTKRHFEGQDPAYKQDTPTALWGNQLMLPPVQVAFAAVVSSLIKQRLICSFKEPASS